MTKIGDREQPLVFEDALTTLDAYWADGSSAKDLDWYGPNLFPIAGTVHDQLTPDGVDNPYWELIRRMPSADSWQGVTPYSYPVGLPFRRDHLVSTYAWSIPSPGDITWVTSLLGGRGMAEVGAGSGYWAWQFAQAGVDVVVYEPTDPVDNTFVAVHEPYHPLLDGDASAAAEYPDRALFMSWPSLGGSWAEDALASYQGDMFVYAGEASGGCCADDGFFKRLGREWVEIEDSPHHRTWWAINCRLTAYRRAGVAS